MFRDDYLKSDKLLSVADLKQLKRAREIKNG